MDPRQQIAQRMAQAQQQERMNHAAGTGWGNVGEAEMIAAQGAEQTKLQELHGNTPVADHYEKTARGSDILEGLHGGLEYGHYGLAGASAAGAVAARSPLLAMMGLTNAGLGAGYGYVSDQHGLNARDERQVEDNFRRNGPTSPQPYLPMELNDEEIIRIMSEHAGPSPRDQQRQKIMLGAQRQ